MSNNQQQSQNSTKTNVFTTYTILYTTFQIIGLALIYNVYYWIINYRGGFSLNEPKLIFNWHPLLMTIGFIYFLANSILHYRTFSNHQKQSLKIQHSVIHGYVIVLVLLAACAALISHVYASPPIPNFYSLHSWLGIFTIVMFLSQFISGLVSFLYPGASIKYKEIMMPYHIYFGVFIFVLAVITAVTGFSEKLIFALDKEYKKFPQEGIFGNFLGLLCILYGGLVVYMVTKPEFKRNPKLEYEPLLSNDSP
ncbi:Cytochrome b561/ferric reductase transmembrane [Cinara cedri]|uniref:Cytochrome b561/ferric reductase transmembrane n=1 Tax=Cinara cedri TaxID=506608 RepID=A0A5E4NSI8_9HEMI|nr:Cytochrome b561/ferric reductase transmembrane [Cinara cedri]